MSTLPATRQERSPAENRALALVHENANRLKAALPEYYSPEKLAQVMTVLVYRNADILRCIPESIITSLITAATLDLDLTPGMNEGCLVPRWNTKLNALECQFQPMYQGLAKLAIRTETVRWIQPREVCEGDEFSVWFVDDKTHINHKPAFGQKRDRVLYYYAIAKMADGDPLIEVMTADDVEAIHQRSDGYKTAQKKGWTESGPWVTDYDAMGRKTVIRKLCKSLPRKSAAPVAAKAFEDLNRAIEADNRQYETDPAESPPKVDNASGFGHGMYASPEQSAEFERKLKGFLVESNDRWLNRLSELCRGDIPSSVKELNEYQADNHLIKWAVETGRLDRAIVPEDVKIRQRYRYTAVVYHRSPEDQTALIRELRGYAKTHWLRQLEALARKQPELAPDIAERFGVGETAPQDDGDPDIDIPADTGREPGCD